MSPQAELLDTGALERLLESVDRVPGIARRVLAEAEDDAAPRLRRLSNAVEAARDDVRWAERAAQDADPEEEDVSELEAQADAARERLARLEEAVEDVEYALSRYRDAARDLADVERQAVGPARAYLEERLAAVRAYLGLRPPGRSDARASAPVPAQGPSSGVEGSTTRAWRDLPPLPKGFAWVPIASIRMRPDDRALEWRKTPEDVMEAGLRAFEADIIPRLREGGADRDALAQIDKEEGRDAGGLMRPDNLANLHDIMFGKDSIAASPEAGGTYSLSSGRHRTEIARRLGWTHVPAFVIGQGGDDVRG